MGLDGIQSGKADQAEISENNAEDQFPQHCRLIPALEKLATDFRGKQQNHKGKKDVRYLDVAAVLVPGRPGFRGCGGER